VKLISSDASTRRSFTNRECQFFAMMPKGFSDSAVDRIQNVTLRT
jgi:hypothetical protein